MLKYQAKGKRERLLVKSRIGKIIDFRCIKEPVISVRTRLGPEAHRWFWWWRTWEQWVVRFVGDGTVPYSSRS